MARADTHLPDIVTVDITVTGVREMRVRMWLAAQLVKLAAWLLGGVGRVEIHGGETSL